MDINQIPKKSWLMSGLKVADSKIDGNGVYTTQDIKMGETVIVWGGIVITIEEFKSGKGLSHTNVGIDEGVFLAESPNSDMTIDDYMNHSCDPNLWLKDEITLIAKRDIKAGEELTMDYAVELADENYVMKKPCNCSAKSCRKTITGKDWMLPEVQRINKDHFSPFINRRIQKLLTEKRNLT
ncbi:MAG: hypothetical protein MHPDNHAH_00393 [Anaerolineales bacterium]|nr:hypothetical protein [Anaerolineales bacterium]